MGGQVLDFIDRHHQSGIACGRGLAGRHEYIGQVFRQQARIRPAGERVDADGELAVRLRGILLEWKSRLADVCPRPAGRGSGADPY